MHLDTFNDNERYFANSAVVSHGFFKLTFNLVWCECNSITPQVTINKVMILITRQYITDLLVYSRSNSRRIWLSFLNVGSNTWHFVTNRSRYIYFFPICAVLFYVFSAFTVQREQLQATLPRTFNKNVFYLSIFHFLCSIIWQVCRRRFHRDNPSNFVIYDRSRTWWLVSTMKIGASS